MAIGDFRLCYKDVDGLPVPCANIRYRVLRGSDLKEMARGTTDLDGRTTRFEENAKPAGQPVQGSELMRWTPGFSMMDSGGIPFRVQVWSQKLSEYGDELDLYPDSPAANLFLYPSDLLSQRMLNTRQVLMKRHLNVRFQFKQGNKPIANAPFVAYTINKDGKEVAAKDLDGKPIKGNTDKHGETGKIHTNDTSWFIFNLPGAGKASYKSDVLEPQVSGIVSVLPVVNVKSQVAAAAPGDGKVAELSGKTTAPVILNADTEELFMLSDEDWKEFEIVSGHIESTMANLHLARNSLTSALEGRSLEDIKQAEKDLGLAEDKVKEMLNKNFSKLADLREVVTFESYDKGRTAGNSLKDRMGMRRRYIPKKKYEEMKAKRLFKTIPFKHDFKLKPKTSAQAGPAKMSDIDVSKIKDSFKKLSVAAKHTFPEKTGQYDFIELAGNQVAETLKETDTTEVEYAAQWLRLVGSAGASAEATWNPLTGKTRVQAQGSLQGKAVLYEGKLKSSYSYPSRRGYQMTLGDESLGAICFVIECELYGFVGAKASLMGSAGITVTKGKAEVRPAQRDRSDNFSGNYDTRTRLPRFDPTALNEAVPKEVNGVSATAEIFAGAEVGITPGGDIRWLPPNEKEFVSFAKLSLDIAVSAGAGASAQLHLYYANGRFRIKVAARLCWGLGAKGAVDFVVDVGSMLKFVYWVYTQLLYAGFKKLTYIAADAFQALSQLMVIVLADTGLSETELGKLMVGEVQQIRVRLLELSKRLENATARNAMANKIINAKDAKWLAFATPETRGMLLYALTRHYAESHAKDIPSVSAGLTDVDVHYLPTHKAAILNVVAAVHTAPEWRNMMEHMTANGAKRADPGKAEGDVMRFLAYGEFLSDDLKAIFSSVNLHQQQVKIPQDIDNEYLEKYLKLRAKLMDVFPKGYEIARNGSLEYDQLAALRGEPSPMFAQADVSEMRLDDPWSDGESKTMMA